MHPAKYYPPQVALPPAQYLPADQTERRLTIGAGILFGALLLLLSGFVWGRSTEAPRQSQQPIVIMPQQSPADQSSNRDCRILCF